MTKPSSLSQRRADRQVTQQSLAEAIGASLSTIRRIECGSVDPSLSIALDVADALGEDTSRLRALFDLPKTDRKGGAQ